MDDEPTMSELRAENERLKLENAALKAAFAQVVAENESLKASKKKNSTNSSKPPSSDGYAKPPVDSKKTQSLREKSGRAPGGQKGHKGSTMEIVSNPDQVVEVVNVDTCECGGSIISTGNVVVRQVTDIETPKKIVVEYRSRDGICDKCGKIHKASFPEGVDAAASYGENVRAFLSYLNSYQLLPLKRATEIMDDLFGVSVSQGTIIRANETVYENLTETTDAIKQEITNSPIVGFDESGIRVDGKLNWLHCARTDSATLYTVHKKRGREAMDAQGILPHFKNTAIHDHWKAYYAYDCKHGECNEHHLRYLVFTEAVLGREWATEMMCLLMRIKKHVDLSKLFGSVKLDKEDIEVYETMYRKILSEAAAKEQERRDKAAEGEPKPARIKKNDSERLISRLAEGEKETLLFMHDFRVPFDNNGSERDIRMIKLKQKISGCFRTKHGSEVFARIRGFVSTVKKKGMNILKGYREALRGRATDYLYPKETPS